MVVMKMKKQIRQSLAAGLDIPPETMCDLPVGTFRGRGELCVENHRGILAYSAELIQVAVKRGSVLVHGRNLTIANMSRRCLCIRGNITMIELE